MNKPIYLDYNATTPIDPTVAEAMMPYIYDNFGNPSSIHQYGIDTRNAVEKARKQVAEMLQCSIDEIIFTSGGTESNNYSIKGIAGAYIDKGNHIITSSIEHPSVIEVCKYLEQKGFVITYLPVDKYGLINTSVLEAAITSKTILITIMHSNNEVGTIEPIEEIAEIAHKHGILIHSDCSQSIGKIPVLVDTLGVDLLSIAGHKFYAPKGVGAMYIRSGIEIEKLTHGANHEMNLRPGTENVLEIVGLGKACELVTKNVYDYSSKLLELRNRLESGLRKNCKMIRVNGHLEKRLPNTLSISFKDVEANLLIAELSEVAVSAGAACHSDKIDISPTLEAMKVPLEYAMGTIRLSIGRTTSSEDIDFAVEKIAGALNKIRSSKTGITRLSDQKKVKLTSYTHGLGCACKIKPQLLQEILKKIPQISDPKILVGTSTSDDASIYKINNKFSIIQTIDFFTPIVDDPFQFGAIAAANSLSDIYAMGGKPLFALNVVGFPTNHLPLKVLEDILEGAVSKAKEAGISIIGGHSIVDSEPKYGLVVTGIIDNNEFISNADAEPGDILLLTKPIGTGILSVAMQNGLLKKDTETSLIENMLRLNKEAAESMITVGVNACTDITGFGLLGHLIEMMKASHTSAIIEFDKIKFLPNTLDYAVRGNIPRGTKDNYNFTEPFIHYDKKITHSRKMLLNDSQTSGGLLISCSKTKSQILLNTLINNGVTESAIIGEVTDQTERIINIR